MKKNMLPLMSAAFLAGAVIACQAMEDGQAPNTADLANQGALTIHFQNMQVHNPVQEMETVLDQLAKASATKEGISTDLRQQLFYAKTTLTTHTPKDFKLEDFKINALTFEAIEWLKYSQENPFEKKEESQTGTKKKKPKAKKTEASPSATALTEKIATSAPAPLVEKTARQTTYFAALAMIAKPEFKEWAAIDFSEDEVEFSGEVHEQAASRYEWAKNKHNHKQTLAALKATTDAAQATAKKNLEQLQEELRNKQALYDSAQTALQQKVTDPQQQESWQKMRARADLDEFTAKGKKELDEFAETVKKQQVYTEEVTHKNKAIARNSALMNYKILRTKEYLASVKAALEAKKSELVTPVNELESSINTLNLQLVSNAKDTTTAERLAAQQQELTTKKESAAQLQRQIDDIAHKIDGIETPRGVIGNIKKLLLG